MNLVRIDQIKLGDTTAASVLNEAGGVLIGPGTALTEALIRRLKVAGVETVSVLEGVQQEAGNPTDSRRRLEELSLRFAGVTDPLLLEIRDVVAKRLESMVSPTAG